MNYRQIMYRPFLSKIKVFFTAIVLFIFFANAHSQQVLIHSHNDYHQAVPFYRAFVSGVYSIEADIYCTDNENELLVAHDRIELPTAPTLDDLYLNPIIGLYRRNQGKAWKNSDDYFQLLVDLKTPTTPTLDILVSKLKTYPEVFDPAVNRHAVRVVITGNMPAPADFHKYPAFIYFDGRLNLTYTQEELKRVPLFSEPFGSYSKWKGQGEMIEDEKKVVESLIQKAHSMGKPIRFWGTPDNSKAWTVLHAMGVDFVNTDKPEECANYFSTAR